MEITYQTNYRFQRSCLLKTYSLVGEEGNTHTAQLCTKPYGTEPHKEGELCGLEVLRKVLWKDKKLVVSAMLCGSLDRREVCGRLDTCICMAESLCCLPETVTALLSAILQYKKLRKNK